MPTQYDKVNSSNGEGEPSTDGVFQRCGQLHKTMGLSWTRYLLKWIIPGFSLMCSFLFQNYLLHIGTYYYVQWMGRLEENLRHRETEITPTGETLSASITDGSLHDLFADVFGYHAVPMQALDFISAFIPMVWFVAVILKVDLHLWTKCCLCGSFLAVGKGICAVVTVVPDSIGWENCKVRLGKSGVAWFQDPHNLNFENGILTSILDLMNLEVFGIIRHGKTRHLRFCGDMVYSGHTYFVTLFALGLFDLIRKNRYERKHKGTTDLWVIWVVGIALTGVVMTDIVLILMNRFHYTLDVFLAVLLVMLYYTNAGVARAVDYWANELWIPKQNQRAVQALASSGWSGEILIPPCFFPFCLMRGRYNIMNQEKDYQVADNAITWFMRENPRDYVIMLQRAYDAFAKSSPELSFSANDREAVKQRLNNLNEAINKLEAEGIEITWEHVVEREERLRANQQRTSHSRARTLSREDLEPSK